MELPINNETHKKIEGVISRRQFSKKRRRREKSLSHTHIPTHTLWCHTPTSPTKKGNGDETKRDTTRCNDEDVFLSFWLTRVYVCVRVRVCLKVKRYLQGK